MNRTTLFKLMVTHFNISELRLLCFELQVDHENLAGDTKADQVRELITLCERLARVADLLAACKRARPIVEWPVFYDPTLSAKPLPIVYKKEGVLGCPPSLFGREALLAHLSTLLEARKRVVLCGLGGVGKTSLAATIANQHLKNGDGLVLWQQMGNHDVESILDGWLWCSATEQEQQEIGRLKGEAKIVALKQLLTRMGFRLCVLDDAREGDTLVSALKALPDTLPLLVTSRLRLALDALVDVGDLTPDSALALLCHHAGQHIAQDPDAARLCKEFGYHAYALEIAGATLKVDELTPKELLADVAGALDDLPAPAGLAEDERQSVRKLLDRSFHALSPATQRVFEAIGSCFVPGFTPDFLAMCMGEEEAVVRRELRELTRRSLAKRQAGKAYFTVHDLTFSYVHRLANAHGSKVDAVVAATARYVRAHAEDYEGLALNQGNILVAAKVSQQEQLDAFIDMIELLTTRGYLDNQGHTLELLSLLDRAIEMLSQQTDGQDPRLHYLWGKRGNAHFNRGEVSQALALYQRAFEQAPNPQRRAILLGGLGKVYSELGRPSEADGCFRQGYELAQKEDDDVALAFVLQQQSVAAGRRGDYEAARLAAAESVEVARRMNAPNPDKLAYALLNLGTAELDAAVVRAMAMHQEAYEMALASGDLYLQASALHSLGCDAHTLGKDRDAAKRYFEKAHRLFNQLGATLKEQEVTTFMKKFGYWES